MKAKWRLMIPAILALLLAAPGPAGAQAEVTGLLIKSYDLLEAGQLDQAQKIFEQILKQDPGNPLALNNLGYLKVKEHRYQEALAYLEQALPKAKGYKVMINRVCDADGICLAFRPLQEVYGNQELEPLVQMNIAMVKARLATK